ncbi:K02A2.6-like [Cordylochernes scorpioides]|uniref:K02A2.6-like n=1 Tax=Cordylochernes scorpioides TaxID=51811 RepID=A0ABY6LFA6_9ARAC|nr:K02A2.6-like [Cordylochernes scorpioides]
MSFLQQVKISKSCEFGELAESLIRDRLICGMLDDTLRERLLKERDLNLGRALEICKIYESAKEQVKNISNSKSSKC